MVTGMPTGLYLSWSVSWFWDRNFTALFFGHVVLILKVTVLVLILVLVPSLGLGKQHPFISLFARMV